MPRYRYEAVDRSGIPIHGTLEAADEATSCQRSLEQRYHKLVSSEELVIGFTCVEGQRESFLPRLDSAATGRTATRSFADGTSGSRCRAGNRDGAADQPHDWSLMPWLYAYGSFADLPSFGGFLLADRILL